MHEIRVPKMTDTMEETKLLEWIGKEGEMVEAHQPLVLLETDKTNYELEPDYGGILHIITPVDVPIPVNHVIAILADSKEEYEQVKSRVEDSD